jgi:transposase InsO family protein
MHIVSGVTANMLRVGKHPAPALSKEAQRRLKWIEYYEAHGRDISATCRHFSIGRPTLYRWLKRYRPDDLRSLESRKTVPKRRRKPTWTSDALIAVRELREQYPRWGKDKLAVLLRKRGWTLSASMVGRMLRHLKATRQLVEPLRGGISARKRTVRPYALRKPKDYKVKEPGDLVQVDTLDVRPLPNVVLKHFTGRDVVSKWDVLGLHGRATATTAKAFLVELQERMPFEIRAIQVDGGSEFKAEFEEACQEAGLKLFALPPRSPKLNGCVERAQRTHTEEFYEFCFAEPNVRSMTPELRAWEQTYNTIRPNQALGYLTPWEYVQNWQQQTLLRKEAV